MEYTKEQQELILSIIKPKPRGGATINLNAYWKLRRICRGGNMSKLREFAKGKPCTFRLSDSCSGDWGEDTVLAHAPSEGKGMGMKSPDSFSGILCYHCHLLADSYGGTEGFSKGEINEGWLRAIYETQEMMIMEGLMIIPPDANKSRNRRRGVV